MKILYFIFALFVLTASVLPCSDGMQETEHKTEHTDHSHAKNHQHSDHADDCAPFCHCDCCSISTVNPSLSLLEDEIEPIPLKNECYYAFYYTYQYSNGVWHPPALV